LETRIVCVENGSVQRQCTVEEIGFQTNLPGIGKLGVEGTTISKTRICRIKLVCRGVKVDPPAL
jgi:hypothetical protein